MAKTRDTEDFFQRCRRGETYSPVQKNWKQLLLQDFMLISATEYNERRELTNRVSGILQFQFIWHRSPSAARLSYCQTHMHMGTYTHILRSIVAD